MPEEEHVILLDRYTGCCKTLCQQIFLFSKASRSALGPTQPPVRWALAGLSSDLRRREREADEHSRPSVAEDKNEWIYALLWSVCFSVVVRN